MDKWSAKTRAPDLILVMDAGMDAAYAWSIEGVCRQSPIRRAALENDVVRATASQQRGLGTATLLVVLAVLVGVVFGLGAYTLVYAKAFSYMSEDPKVCANCHIMQSQFDSWQKSSHHHVAICNDCHLPRGFAGKYAAKALNGFNHAKAYTLQDFAEPIAIKPFNSEIVQEACLACHRALVHEAVTAPGRGNEMLCVHCHSSAGHGERAGLGGPLT